MICNYCDLLCTYIYIYIYKYNYIYIYTLYLNCIYHMRVSILRVTCVSLDMGYLPASIQPAQRLRGNTYLQPLVLHRSSQTESLRQKERFISLLVFNQLSPLLDPSGFVLQTCSGTSHFQADAEG